MYLTRVDAQRATIQSGEYNFEPHGKHFDNFWRNTFTKIGGLNATRLGLSEGKEYMIHYRGYAKINQYQPYVPYR